ncbi:MAG: hypothetical protein NPIRA01_07050 [Nitrospirales bacterium]|nr:MAG: hypothetical protein NPIRA01_07050 [Nitrospirales bacterium]
MILSCAPHIVVILKAKYLCIILAAWYVECYSWCIVSADGPVKALLIAMAQDPAPAVCSLQRLIPERLCFFLPESSKKLVESDVHPQLSTMPQKWDWILTPDPENFAQSHKTLAELLPKLLKSWDVNPGELVIDITMATSPMAAAMVLVGFPYTAKVVTLSIASAERQSDSKVMMAGEAARTWIQSNPWDEEAFSIRQEASGYFNQGSYVAAAKVFRRIEARVSGGLKPLYRALSDISEGYRQWEQFHYRQAWEKLKSASKALDLASAWGGPPGISSFLRGVKENVRFLENIVLDPAEVKSKLAQDLLAHAKRQIEQQHDAEIAIRVLLRGLTASAQARLFHTYQIKSWDVKLEQLPKSLQEICRNCYLNDVDGKHRLPFPAQFHVLAEHHDIMGKTFLSEWPKMKTLIDAADHAVLGQGFEPVKAERFHQLYDLVLKISAIHERDLPQFPPMAL